MQHGSWHQATIITKEAKHQQELRVGMLSNWRHLQWIRMKIACMIQERETFDSPKRLGSTDMGPRMEQESSRNELNNLFQFLSLALHHQIWVSSHSRKEKPPGRAHVIWAPVEDTEDFTVHQISPKLYSVKILPLLHKRDQWTVKAFPSGPSLTFCLLSVLFVFRSLTVNILPCKDCPHSCLNLYSFTFFLHK